MEDIKSIFKQEIHLRIYEPLLQKRETYMGLDAWYQYSKTYEDKIIESKEVFTTHLDYELKIGDEFYIEEKCLVGEIYKIIKTSGNKTLYYLKPAIIEDNKSLSRVDAFLETEDLYKWKSEMCKKESDSYDVQRDTFYTRYLYMLQTLQEFNKLPFWKKAFTRLEPFDDVKPKLKKKVVEEKSKNI